MISLSEADTDFFKALGQRIAQARKDAGLTQQQLADTLDIGQPVLASYEIGRRRVPVSALGPIAKALKVPVEHLLGEEPATAKRGPAPKLQRQIDQVATLPRAQQQFVSQFLDTVLKQAL
ncbi:MAG: helix-turn-helix domain-containing protein [Verrucomicrobiales bacterium]